LTTSEGVPFVVVDLSGSEAEVDFNHPLAGKHVIIDVKILDVQPTPMG
jgi:FKBP-type peptidyl-prolyl cis-trans isomerase 2